MSRYKDSGSRYAAKKGRSSTDRFARLAHRLLTTAAYRALSPNARALLVEFAMMENGRNNGVGLFLSVRDAAARMGVADLKAASRAIEELQSLGFIELTAEAHFAIKAGNGSRARFWRLTWQAVNGKRGPTNDFERLEPAPRTKARQRMDAGLRALKRWKKQSEKPVEDSTTHLRQCVEDFATTEKSDPVSVEETATQNRRNDGKPPISIVGDSSTYTADQSVAGSRTASLNGHQNNLKIAGGDLRGGESRAPAAA